MAQLREGQNYVAPVSYDSAAAVTPSDTVDITDLPDALYVGVVGNVSIKDAAGTTITFVGVAAGSILPIRARRVMSTLTTASSILALYY